MNKPVKLLVFLAVAIVAVCVLVYFSGDLLILIKGIVGLAAVVLVAAIVVSLIERVQKSSEVKK